MKPLEFNEEFDALAKADAEKLKASEGLAQTKIQLPGLVKGTTKPRLQILKADPDVTVADLRDILAQSDEFYDRGIPVRLTQSKTVGTAIQILAPDALIILAHQLCRPFEAKQAQDGNWTERNTRLPKDVAMMYLAWQGSWNLRPLNGITSAPMLSEDGAISGGEGYDASSGIWQEDVPDVSNLIPIRPTHDDAKAALSRLRETFATFCFADAQTVIDPVTKVNKIDLAFQPGRDESAFLVALLTAVCRPSLHLAPGILLHAAPLSGAGAGKGLLARCIAQIAFGRDPHAVTAGPDNQELEKRIAAELIQGSPVVFLDNLNNRAFKSDQLASAITERPARVRVFGKLEMVALNTCALIMLTGNGLTVTEDLARRFIAIELDPKTEDPESRRFHIDIRAEVGNRRSELLAACLTIWRWGRLQNLESGLPLGSFEQWCKWVRDPLLALGCQDPVARVREAKNRDSQRQQVLEFFNAWHLKYGDRALTIAQLNQDILGLIDPQGRGRQFATAKIQKLVGTRIGGLLLSCQQPAGKWGTATYAITPIAVTESTDDRSDGAPLALTINTKQQLPRTGQGSSPMTPMPPMPLPVAEEVIAASDPQPWRMKL
jgi:hypothetical protein